MNNLSWENPPYNNIKEYEKLCKDSMPQDFYFCCFHQYDESETLIAICAKKYFDKENYQWDQSLFLNHILPDDFCESMEGIWDSERSLEEIRKDLLDRGFIENEKFSKFIIENNI